MMQPMNIRSPVEAAVRLYKSSVQACKELVTSPTQDSQLDAQGHAQYVRQARTKARKVRMKEETLTVEGLLIAAITSAVLWPSAAVTVPVKVSRPLESPFASSAKLARCPPEPPSVA